MRAKRQFYGQTFSGMSGYLGASGPSVSVIPATGGNPIPVSDAATLANYISQGADVLINGSVVQPSMSSSTSGPVWMINGQPLCDLFGTCGPSSSISQPILITSPGPGIVPGALTPSMTPSDSSGQAGSAVYINSSTAAAIAPTLQPNQPGSSPAGTGSSSTPYTTVPTNCLGPNIYRFILNNNGIFQTGSSRGGCSPTNTAACDPQTFSSLSQAIQYALSNGEVPYQVSSSAEPWAIMNCQEGINPAQIYNADGSLGSGLLGGLSTTDILIGLGLAYLLLRKK